MKTMLLCDLVTMRQTLRQLAGSVLLVLLIVTLATRDLLGGPIAGGYMFSFMYLFNAFGMDENGGWASFRLTLPLTRRDVMLGRYASVLAVIVGANVLLVLVVSALATLWQGMPPHIASLLSQEDPSLEALARMALLLGSLLLVSASFAMPCFARFGITKGSRVLLMLFFVVPTLVIAQFGSELAGSLSTFVTSSGPLVLFLSMLAFYALSALLSVRLYETREL